MSINFIFELIIAMVIGTIVSYLTIQGAGFAIRYIRKRNIGINAEEFTDDEVVLDARDWCKEDDRITFIMVKTQDKANLVTKDGVLDATDIYNKFHKEENNGQEDDDADRTDAGNDVDSADEDRQ